MKLIPLLGFDKIDLSIAIIRNVNSRKRFIVFKAISNVISNN